MKKLIFFSLLLILLFPLFGQEEEPGPSPPAGDGTEQIGETDAGETGGPVTVPPSPEVPSAFPPAEPGSYEDLLSRLLKMEEQVYQGELGIQDIRLFKEELGQTGYPELEAEAALLEFLLVRKDEEEARRQGLDAFLSSLNDAAQREEEEARRMKSRKIWTGVTLGTSLLALGGVTYLRSLGNETYQLYLEAQTPQESAYYQGWWRTWDLASAVTGGVGVLSFTAFLYFFGSSL